MSEPTIDDMLKALANDGYELECLTLASGHYRAEFWHSGKSVGEPKWTGATATEAVRAAYLASREGR